MARSKAARQLKADPLIHQSGGGKTPRHNGNFVRGSQLLGHRYFMLSMGARVPLYIWLAVFIALYWIDLSATLGPNDMQLILMRAGSWLNGLLSLDEMRAVNLTLRPGTTVQVPVGFVPFVPEVVLAWARAVRGFVGSLSASLVIAIPISYAFITWALHSGKEAMTEHHERGSRMIDADVLRSDILAYNGKKFTEQAAKIFPTLSSAQVSALPYQQRKDAGIHHPYSIAHIPYPHGLEASHTMLVGTTGTGKSTVFKSIIRQIRARGHSAVIFDLTGGFVEHFYDPARDIILNPNDVRSAHWRLADDCATYSQYHSASEALIPAGEGGGDPFWAEGARSLFIEMAVKLKEHGLTSNKDLVDRLMKADLKSINRMLAGTIAEPMTDDEVKKTALSVRMVFNASATIFRFLPDGDNRFSIRDWITTPKDDGGILFISSRAEDLSMTRTIITLWMNTAINAMMTLPKTRQVNTWFLFDELGALHKLPAIENGLQTARQFGGAFLLGVHSFSALEKVYGKDGARNLISLARTKLVLATSDRPTAEDLAKLIGQREVRKVDETISYGGNNARDASTITSDRRVENLILPDDILDLPSLSGIIKFPEGFAAARIKLAIEDLPIVAADFIRRKDEIQLLGMHAAPDADFDEDAVIIEGSALGQNESVDADGVVTTSNGAAEGVDGDNQADDAATTSDAAGGREGEAGMAAPDTPVAPSDGPTMLPPDKSLSTSVGAAGVLQTSALFASLAPIDPAKLAASAATPLTPAIIGGEIATRDGARPEIPANTVTGAATSTASDVEQAMREHGLAAANDAAALAAPSEPPPKMNQALLDHFMSFGDDEGREPERGERER